MTARVYYDFDPVLGREWGDRIKKILDDQDLSYRDFCVVLARDGFKANHSMVGRALNGGKATAHMMQAIARSPEILRHYPIPAGYKGDLLNLFLDEQSGRVRYYTPEKISRVADELGRKLLETETTDSEVQGEMARKEAIALMQKIAAGRSAQQLSRIVNISASRLQEIMDGSEPDSWEYIELGPLFADNSARSLWKAHNEKRANS